MGPSTMSPTDEGVFAIGEGRIRFGGESGGDG